MPTIADTHIVNRERVQPTHANNYDSAHGGLVMKWMDEIGAMSAMRAAQESCVTAQMSRVDFDPGVTLRRADRNVLTGNTIRRNRIGVLLEDADDNLLEANTICENTDDQIVEAGDSDRNRFVDNDLTC